MKKAICFTLCLLTFFFISGCNSMNFSKKSTETGTYVNDEVSLEIKNDSIDNSGLVLLISNKTNTDLTYDSTYFIEQKKDGVWYSSDNEQYFNALAILLESKATNEFEVDFETTLPQGEYRIIKSINVSTGSIPLMVDFKIS